VLEALKNTRFNLKLSFPNNRGHQDVKGLKVLDIMLKNTKKYIGNVASIRVEKYFTFSNQGLLGSIW